MNWLRRCLLTALVLSLGLLGQKLLARHLAGEVVAHPVELTLPLAELPLELAGWQGRDEPITDPRHLYAETHLRRTYVNPQRQQAVAVWLAFSSNGADRKHHPEVCLAVAGELEDTNVREQIFVPSSNEPIQQFRFGRNGEHQWVFYWHYTLPVVDDEPDLLRQLHRRIHTRPASLTVEVFAGERHADDVEAARQFVAALEQAVRRHVGPAATMGSQRLPVTIIEGWERQPTPRG